MIVDYFQCYYCEKTHLHKCPERCQCGNDIWLRKQTEVADDPFPEKLDGPTVIYSSDDDHWGQDTWVQNWSDVVYVYED